MLLTTVFPMPLDRKLSLRPELWRTARHRPDGKREPLEGNRELEGGVAGSRGVGVWQDFGWRKRRVDDAGAGSLAFWAEKGARSAQAVKPEAIARWLWVKFMRPFVGHLKGIEEMVFKKGPFVADKV